MTSGAEMDILETLRPDYEARGFRFIAQPSGSDVPSFLQGHLPDAIARRNEDGVIIEVQTAPRRGSELKLSQIAALVREQPRWDFLVVHANERPEDAIRIESSTRDQIRRFVDRIAQVRAATGDELAFVSAWIALEALARYVDRQEGGGLDRALSPIQVVQRLAASGYLEAEAAVRLRELARSRSRYVHGAIDLTIKPDDVTFVIEVVQRIFRDVVAQDA